MDGNGRKGDQNQSVPELLLLKQKEKKIFKISQDELLSLDHPLTAAQIRISI